MSSYKKDPHRFVVRFALVLLVCIVSTGCTTTQSVSRVDVIELDELNRELRGRTIGIEFVNGTRERGQLEFVRLDSLAWQSGGVRHVVPIHHVDRLISDNRHRSIRDGALIGSGVGMLFILASLISSDSSRILLRSVEPFIILSGWALTGSLYGVIGGQKRVYKLQNYAPWHLMEMVDSGISGN